MKNRRFFFYQVFLVSSLLLLAVSNGFAASDGSLGDTSTGSLSLSIEIPTKVRITGISDLNVGTFSGSGDLNVNDNVCVYTNAESGEYKITASGNGIGNAFTVKDDAERTIPYEVYWNDANGTTGNVQATSGSVITSQGNADTTSQTCTGSTNANFQVIVRELDLQTKMAGTYTGTLTLLIEPM